jgi:DNA-directed RNA polymerase specialized sigma24 family protein
LTLVTSASELAATASSDNPEEGLRAVVALRQLLERLEYLHVRRAREQGWSWQDIAQVLGVSRQAVHQKHGAALPAFRKD